MTERSELAKNFIHSTKWKEAAISKVAGDASNRSYDRLTDTASDTTAIFMNAPPEKGEDVRPFVQIATHLQAVDLSAPKILEQDLENGFLILEDLGDDLFSRIVPQRPELESTLYAGATDVLLHLHRADLPEVGTYDPALMSDLSSLSLTKYASAQRSISDQDLLVFRNSFQNLLENAVQDGSVLILRDYHADNLLWLPERAPVARIGLLDFQDAMIGHPAYDLVSLLQDVRRDVPEEIEDEMVARYIAKSGVERAAFRRAYSVLGAQRALRILGVFARLGREYGKPHYVDMIPKVWRVLNRNLDQSALEPVAGLLRSLLPEPDKAMLARLREHG